MKALYDYFYSYIKINDKKNNIYLLSKTVKYKSYSNLQSLLVPTHMWKPLFIDFLIRLPIFAVEKDKNYNSIQVIMNWWTKIIHNKLLLILISTYMLVKIILDIIL